MNILLLSGLILLFGCGKSSSNSSPNSNQTRETVQAGALTGKSLDEVLTLKYSSVSVDCALRLQESEAVDLARLPDHTFLWKLPADKNAERVVPVKFGQLEGTMTFTLPIILLIDNLTHTNPSGEEYHLEFTPKVVVYSSRSLKYVSLPDLTMFHRGYEVDLVENTGYDAKTTVLSNELTPHVIDLRCALNTVVKPGYEDQFKRIK